MPDARSSSLCFQIPPLWARLLCAGIWKELLIPEWDREDRRGFRGVRSWSTGFSKLMMNWPSLNLLRVVQFDVVDAPNLLESTSVTELCDLLCALRNSAMSVPSAANLLDSASSWIDRLRRSSDDLQLMSTSASGLSSGQRLPKGSAYGIIYMLNCFLLCSLLHQDSDLTEALVNASRILLPSNVAQRVVERLLDRSLPTPSKSCISKKRTTIDVAYMLLMREQIDKFVDENVCTYLQVDSSPQGGTDYELVVLHFVLLSNCGKAVQVVRDLALHNRISERTMKT